MFFNVRAYNAEFKMKMNTECINLEWNKSARLYVRVSFRFEIKSTSCVFPRGTIVNDIWIHYLTWVRFETQGLANWPTPKPQTKTFKQKTRKQNNKKNDGLKNG